MKGLISGLLLFALSMGLVACGGGDDGPTATGPSEEQLAQLSLERDVQRDWFEAMALLGADTDTAAAIEAMTAVIAADPAIDWARNTLTGVSFRWKSGRPGFVILDPRAGPRAGESPGLEGAAENPGARKGAAQSPLVVPRGRKSVYLAPAYSEFELWDDSLIGVADTSLAKVGMDRFVLYEDHKCTLGLIRGLSQMDIGVLRLSSHGAAWPSPQDIQEVYFITGEVPTEASDKTYWKEINETYSVSTGSYAGENRYFISDDFFAANVDFGDRRPFVSLGFCFGNLGHWPETVTNTCKAGATLGWDWAVFAHRDAPRVEWFFSDLCDTSRAPMTLGAWFSGVNGTYQDDQDGREVHLGYHGSSSFAMFEALRLEAITPVAGRPGDTVILTGSGFGATRGTVWFDAIEATTISAWSDGEIRVEVPAGLNEGQYAVTVKVGGLASNAVSFSIAGDLLLKLQGCTLIDVSFVAEHRLASGATTESLFNPSLRTIEWSGSNFSGRDSTVIGDETYTARFSGSVGPDGRTLDFQWTTERRATYSNGGSSYTRSSARVTGLPYVRDQREFGNQEVVYAAPAGSVAGFIGSLEYETTTWNAAGVILDADSYAFTNWGASGNDLLEVTLLGFLN